MKKKIMCIILISIFLLASFTVFPVSGKKQKLKTNNSYDNSNRAYITVKVIQAGSLGRRVIPNVELTCKGLFNGYSETNVSNENGLCWFGYNKENILSYPGIYYIRGEKKGYFSGITLIHFKIGDVGSIGTSLVMYKSSVFKTLF